MLITAYYQGKLRALTVHEWAELLGMTKTSIYNRKDRGWSDQDSLLPINAVRKTNQPMLSEREVAILFEQFNFHKRINKNEIR